MKIRVNMESLITFGKALTSFRHLEEITLFPLKDSDGTDLPGGPVNGRMLKHYLPPQ
jgi:hypothetical protein